LLAHTCRVTTYDRRGHSASERLDGQGSIREDVGDLAALIEQLGLAPALIGLLDGNPGLAAVQQRIGAVIETLSAGQMEAGARQFVETIAFGPGMWDQLSPEMRKTFVFNASTWQDEMREPAAFTIDLDRLSVFGGALLMSQGDQSPPFFGAILE